MPSAYISTATDSLSLNPGRTVTGFDVNGDGRGDIIIGADLAENDDFEVRGQVLVIYGSAFADEAVNLDTDLNGVNGFVIDGPSEGSEFGWTVQQISDLTGDTNPELVIGARAEGEVYILPGSDSNFDASVDISTASDVITITGLPTFATDLVVTSVGDVNEDGVDDLTISVSVGGASDTTYVVFGDELSAGTTLDIDTLDGSNGFSVIGLDLANNSGSNSGVIGDIDGDGINDLLLGRPGPDMNGIASSDIVIWRGQDTDDLLQASFDIDDFAASDLITLTGLDNDDAPGASVSGNIDLNDDGISDLIVADPAADNNGNNAGAVYVVFGSVTLPDSVDLTALDGTDGFAILGLAANDALGTVVEGLGDVTGDDIDDLGIMTASGDLYIVYGSDAGFGATLDLSALDGSNGYAISGLFENTPESLSLSMLPNVNTDDINDIAVAATFTGGTEGQTTVILGGAQNFQNLDDADGGVDDGEIDFSTIGAVEFGETDGSVIVSGDNAVSIDEDDADGVNGAIAIEDPDDATVTFADRSAVGLYGGLVVNAAGNAWTYTLTDNAALQDLDEGDTLTDIIEVIATNGSSSQTVTVTILGLDDPAVFVSDDTPEFTEDFAQFTSGYSYTDVDADDTAPSLDGLIFEGTYGRITFNDDSYTYFVTDSSVQDLADGADLTDTVTVTDEDDNNFDVVVTISGADEGITVNLGDDGNEVFFGFGDDIVNGEGGDDTIDTGAGDDTVDGGSGNDMITDPLGDDDVSGGDDRDEIKLLSGDNTVGGDDGNDFILTGYGNDTINGGAGDDIISADEAALFIFGNDTITGGTGDDLMSGGIGADTFIFRENEGDNTIASFDSSGVTPDGSTWTAAPNGADFEVGIDTIYLDITGVDETNVMSFISDGSGGAVFDSGDGTTITFYNILAEDLSASDFTFDII